MEYKAVSTQVSRFKKRLADDTRLRRKVAQCQQVFVRPSSQIQNVEALALPDERIRKIADAFDIANYEFIAGDMEQVALPHGMDLVLSNAAFQWLTKPGAFLHHVVDCLAPGGILAFATFGPDQYKEIASLTGDRLPYLSLDACCGALEGHGTVLYTDEDLIPMVFDSPVGVLSHIRDTGVNAVRRRFWTRGDQRRFVKQYQEQFPHKSGVRLTYNPIYVVFRKAM